MGFDFGALMADPNFQQLQKTNPDKADAYLKYFHQLDQGTATPPGPEPVITPKTVLPLGESDVPPEEGGHPRLDWTPLPPPPTTPTQQWEARQLGRAANLVGGLSGQFPGAKEMAGGQPPLPQWVQTAAPYLPATPEDVGVDIASLIPMILSGGAGAAGEAGMMGAAGVADVARAAGGAAEVGGVDEAAAAIARELGFEPEVGGLRKVAAAPLRRMAFPPAVGAGIGAIAHPENRWQGALGGAEKGLEISVPSEIIPLGIGVGGRIMGKEGAIERYVGNVGNLLHDFLQDPIDPAIADIRLPSMTNAGDWSRNLVGKNAPYAQETANAMNTYQDWIAHSLVGDTPIPVQFEGMKDPISKTFPEWLEQISDLEKRGGVGRTIKGMPKGNPEAVQALERAQEARQGVAKYLNKMVKSKDIGSNWLEYRARYGMVRELSDTLTTKGAKAMRGQSLFMDPENIQRKMISLFGEGDLANQMQNLLGRDRWNDFMYRVRAGLPNPKAPIPAESSRLYMGHSLLPRAHLGKTFKPFGEQPWYIYPPRAPFYGMAGPASRLVRPFLPPVLPPSVSTQVPEPPPPPPYVAPPEGSP